MLKFLCGCPQEHCNGSNMAVNQGLKHSGGMRKVHSSSKEAFKCYSAWMVAQGYTRLTNQEYYKPGHPIVMLNKQGKFGAVLRIGKGMEGSSKGNRFVPKHGHRSRPGVIV